MTATTALLPGLGFCAPNTRTELTAHDLKENEDGNDRKTNENQEEAHGDSSCRGRRPGAESAGAARNGKPKYHRHLACEITGDEQQEDRRSIGSVSSGFEKFEARESTYFKEN